MKKHEYCKNRKDDVQRIKGARLSKGVPYYRVKIIKLHANSK